MWSRNTLKIKRKYKYQICRASSPRLKAGASARRLVIRSYASEGYRDLAKTYVSNMIAISNDDMLDMPQRSELCAVCDVKFDEALARCREIRRESMETYMQTWKERVDNYHA